MGTQTPPTATVPTGATVQWYRCAPDVSHCVSIHGAKAATYTLVAKDVGKTIASNVKATDATMTYGAAVGPIAATGAKQRAPITLVALADQAEPLAGSTR